MAQSIQETIVLVSPDSHDSPMDLDLDKFMGTWHVTHSTLPLWKSRKDVTITYAMKTSPSDGTTQFDDIVEYRSKSDPPSSKRSRVVGVDSLMSMSSPDSRSTSHPDGKPCSGSGPNSSEVTGPGAPKPSSPASALGVDAGTTEQHIVPGRSIEQEPLAPHFHSRAGDSTGDAKVKKPAQTRLRFKWRGKGWLVIASSRWQVLGCSPDPSPANTQGAWAVTYFEKTLFTPAGLDIYARTAQGLPEHTVRRIIEKVKGLGGQAARLADGFFEVERSPMQPSEPPLLHSVS